MNSETVKQHECAECGEPASTYVDRDELGVLVYHGDALIPKLERALANAKADAIKRVHHNA